MTALERFENGGERSDGVGEDQRIEGQTQDGYVVVEMICHDEGVTSPGGCRVEDDADTITEVRDK
jgi:hypothetical protein